MDSFEFNKIAGGVLGSLLLLVVIGHVGDFLVHSDELDAPVVVIDVPESATPDMAEEAPPPEQSVLALLAGADVAAGEDFAGRCGACHSFERGGANGIGPALWDVVGRDLAAVEGYSYSGAMADAGGAWTYETLDAFLTSPKDAVPGTKMSFSGVRRVGQRADLIAWLRTLSDSPMALPGIAEEAAMEEMPSEDAEQAAMEQAAAEQAAAEEEAAMEQAAAEQAAEEEAMTQAAAEQAAARQASAPADGMGARLAAADAEAGQRLARRCGACHTFDEGGANRVGPNLWGVVGRDVAGGDGFNYSAAMTDKGGAWSFAALDAFFADPRGDVPGTRMSFAGIDDPADRANLILWLRSLSGAPVALPGE